MDQRGYRCLPLPAQRLRSFLSHSGVGVSQGIKYGVHRRPGVADLADGCGHFFLDYRVEVLQGLVEGLNGHDIPDHSQDPGCLLPNVPVFIAKGHDKRRDGLLVSHLGQGIRGIPANLPVLVPEATNERTQGSLVANLTQRPAGLGADISVGILHGKQ